ncbi:MAG: bifunctional pyr operon transcriptional regulator/uracil phosphoribosyltransferase PyrR [Bdellovibrionota bacterium]|jgi:pyrimidine operon attenuation protein/uracil phosphoribosyltransferase
MSDAAVKEIPSDWKLLVNSETIARCVTRISYEIVEKNRDLSHLAIVGIRSAGEFLGQRIHDKIEEIEKRKISFGVIDITLYRDDLAQTLAQPILKGSHLPFSIDGARIVLVDDILYTGRTVRSALDCVVDFGRPACVEFAVLIDRGHRELPIRADYVGKNLPTRRDDKVRVKLTDQGFADDGVYLVKAGAAKEDL